MRRLICSLLLCVVVLSGCGGATKKTATSESPAHNVPSSVYPAPNAVNPQNAEQANQPYPGPQGNNPANTSSGTYPGPATPGGQTPPPESYAPAPEDEALTRGDATVTLKDSKVIPSKSSPVQIKLHLTGTLPNPCYHLRVNPAQPDAKNQIQVDVYSVVDPKAVCTDVIQEFTVEIPLGSFPSGHYSVLINGKLLGEFDA